MTSEAGLNDGLSFPFVYLAIAIALSQACGEPFLVDWLWLDVFWRIGAGVAIGWVGGKVMGLLTFRPPNRTGLAQTRDGFVALGITCLAYGSTELANGYGFLAVCDGPRIPHCGAPTQISHRVACVRRADRAYRNDGASGLFGSAIAEGTIFDALSWEVIAVSALVLFLVRPLSAWVSLLGHSAQREEKWVISFLGIRGLGSFYYVAYALGHAEFVSPEIIWVTVCYVVLVSIFIHGILVTPMMRQIDRSRRSRPGAKELPPL